MSKIMIKNEFRRIRHSLTLLEANTSPTRWTQTRREGYTNKYSIHRDCNRKKISACVYQTWVLSVQHCFLSITSMCIYLFFYRLSLLQMRTRVRVEQTMTHCFSCKQNETIVSRLSTSRHSSMADSISMWCNVQWHILSHSSKIDRLLTVTVYQ